MEDSKTQETIDNSETKSSETIENIDDKANAEHEQRTTNNEQLSRDIGNDLNDKYLRLSAEFDNYKKRTSKEIIEFRKSANEYIISTLLPVVDDFERAVKSNETTTDADVLKNGIKLIHQKLNTILTKNGLEIMDAKGKEFNADLHEAITNVSAPSEDMKGKVMEELEKGYYLNGKVIRYAKVIVGN